MIQIADELRVVNSDSSRTIRGTKPGENYWPADLRSLNYLIGFQLTEAIAKHDGCLILAFETEERIEIESTTGYEAWHFYCPRPGTRKSRRQMSVHGTYGSLICFS